MVCNNRNYPIGRPLNIIFKSEKGRLIFSLHKEKNFGSKSLGNKKIEIFLVHRFNCAKV